MSLKISGDCQPPPEQPSLGLLLSKNEWKKWMDELQAYFDDVYLILFSVHSNFTLWRCCSKWLKTTPSPVYSTWESKSLPKTPVNSWACILLVLLPLHFLLPLLLLALIQTGKVLSLISTKIHSGSGPRTISQLANNLQIYIRPFY